MNRYVYTAAGMNALAISMYTVIGRVSFHGNRITQCSIYCRNNSECHSWCEVGLPSSPLVEHLTINKSSLPARLGVQ